MSETLLWENLGQASKESWCDCVSVICVAAKGLWSQIRWASVTFKAASGWTDREVSLTKINVTIENRIYICSVHCLSCSFARKERVH